MCGGVKASERFRNQKEDQINRELERLSNLKQGYTYSWPTSEGIQNRLFAGHIRSETMNDVWGNKIAKHLSIHATQFMERDTVGGSNQLKSFNVPSGKGLHAAIMTDGSLRLVTRAAQGDEAKVHHRAPQFIDL